MPRLNEWQKLELNALRQQHASVKHHIDALESSQTTLLARLRESQKLLRVASCFDAGDSFQNQIAANEAALKEVGGE